MDRCVSADKITAQPPQQLSKDSGRVAEAASVVSVVLVVSVEEEAVAHRNTKAATYA